LGTLTSKVDWKEDFMNFLHTPMLADLLWFNGGSFSLLLVAAVAFVVFRR